MLMPSKTLLIAALLASLASEEIRSDSRFSRVLGLTDDRSSPRAKRHREQPEYFEQCRLVNMWKEHLGHVSVLAFLDPSWQYSFRQAVMLAVLSSRLRRSGFLNIRFFVISPPPDLTRDETEGDDEIEAWRQISTMFPDTEDFMNTNVHIFKEDEPEMILLQDGPRFQMWKRFRASRDQMIVIDRCGRLTYQVIVPWSILHFPYVKAAILSTYQEDPCGKCNLSMRKAPDNEVHLSGSTRNGTEREIDPREADNVDADSIRTIERSKNASLRLNESSEERHGARGIVRPIPLGEATDDTDRLDLASVTELSARPEIAYQYDNDTTGQSHGDTVENQGESTNSSRASETTFESQRDVSITRQRAYEKNNSTNDGDMRNDRVLMLDEPVIRDNVTNDATETTTIPDEVAADNEDDEVTSNDGNANVSSENLTEYGQNDSVDKSETGGEAAGIEGMHLLPLPLRVIMYAPHVHRDDEKMKKYTHLILRTDDPDYHEHLDSGISVVLPTDLSRDGDSQIANSKERDQGVKINRRREDTDQKYIFDRDESPGLYGEIVDYWRSCEDSDITDRNETSNDNYNSTINYHKHPGNASEHSVNFSKSSEAEKGYSNANITIDTNTEDSVNSPNIIELNKANSLEPINENEQVNGEDEMRNKLIEHYNKLLTWIDYRLNR